MDLDTFFVSCERLLDSRLNNKPILVGGTSDRGVVASCSYEARTYGIHSAMPMKMARQLCPEAIIIRGNSGIYSKYSNMVTEIIKERVPVYEKTSIDEFYIDLTGMDQFFGCYSLASEIRQTIMKETGLPISFGMSANKTVSKVATGEAKPNNQKDIARGLEKPFLAPLPVKKIPMVGSKTALLLRKMGVQQIKTLQQMPKEMMERTFGVNGVAIWKKANGIDPSPVIPYNERKSISMERTFERDTVDVQRLKDLIRSMAEKLAYELRMGNRLTACVTVKIRYSDFSTYSKQRRIPYSSSDHKLLKCTQELFDSLYERRLSIRLVGVRFSHLITGGHQIDLFEDNVDTLNLYEAMDRIRNRYGSSKIFRASAIKSQNLSRGNPFNGEPNIIPAHRRA
jgi:DNA polymerase-4